MLCEVTALLHRGKWFAASRSLGMSPEVRFRWLPRPLAEGHLRRIIFEDQCRFFGKNL
jgi:hypothetical protein